MHAIIANETTLYRAALGTIQDSATTAVLLSGDRIGLCRRRRGHRDGDDAREGDEDSLELHFGVRWRERC
ncbi:hypothetical protein CCHR01_06230 [Colletotrichum chrysophilum]|uniref:Uncharacterized protein n=1 Tax=Colletotrichum chrysophilum TaxID=1836956 RepID=A0AAD9EJY7_9PEZI|nr:hypothetical protein CCHR01_06230 [Colletotrichum chrysophilum]